MDIAGTNIYSRCNSIPNINCILAFNGYTFLVQIFIPDVIVIQALHVVSYCFSLCTLLLFTFLIIKFMFGNMNL